MNYKNLENDKETRTESIIIRVTKGEKQTLASETQKLGISISAFIRLLLRNWADGITFEKNHTKDK